MTDILTTLRQELKAHQEATDTTDDEMLSVVCRYLETEQTDFNDEHFIEYVVSCLERMPGDMS